MAQTGAGSIQGTLRDTTAAVISRRVPMLIRPAIGDTDPIRYRRPTPDGQFSGNIIDEAMRPFERRVLALANALNPFSKVFVK